MRLRWSLVPLFLALCACGPAAAVPEAILPGVQADVQGVVVDEAGHAVPGAAVWESSLRPRDGDKPTAVSGPDGRFTVAASGLRDRVALTACAPGFLSGDVASRERPEAPVRIVLRRAVRMTGRILGPDGQPVAGATVDAFMDGKGIIEEEDFGPCREPGYRAYGTSGPDGRFTLDHLEAGSYFLGVSALGFVRGGPPQAVRAAAGQTLELAPMALDRGSTVAGRILSADGAPASGAKISLGAGETTADAQGNYRLAGVRPGVRNWLTARHPDFGAVQVPFVAIAAAADKAGENRFDVRFAEQGEIRGRVMGPNGQPVAGAEVRLASRVTTSAADGSFRLRDRPGPSRLDVRRAGFGRAVLRVTVPSGESSGETGPPLEVRLPAACAITGKVHGLTSFAGAGVAAIDFESSTLGTLDAAGQYRFANLAPGRWEIAAFSGLRFVRVPVDIAPGTPETVVDLTLPPAFAIRGKVSGADGRLLPRVRLRFGEGLQAEADDKGLFAVEIAPGTYQVSVLLPDGSVSFTTTLVVRGAMNDVEIRP